MAAYATALDLVTRHDISLIGQLISDDEAMPSRTDIMTHENLTAALEDASGQVEAAMLNGARYRPEALESLTGNSLAHLKRVTCTIAMANLCERRPMVHTEAAEAYLKRAKEFLEDLRAGRNLFNLADNITDANPTIDGPTSTKYEELNLLPDRMVRYFPSRLQRLPTTRG